MTNCPNDRFTHNSFESYSEGRYVTAELLASYCRNDEYLYRRISELDILTPPAIRKRFNPPAVNEAYSYGYKKGKDSITFDNADTFNIFIDFTDMSLVDEVQTTALIHSRVNNGQTLITAETPKTTQSTLDRSTHSVSPWPQATSPTSVNERWYIGYNKSVPYRVQPNWLEGEEEGRGIYNTEIPTVGRAQTFKPNKSGYLEGVTIHLKCDWKNNTASPFIVQVRPTETRDGVKYPVKYHYKNLAEQRVRFNNSDPDLCTINFDYPPYLDKNTTYALVFLSPLTHKDHAYWLGGWSRNCQGEPYANGDAFLTENNGGSWMRYGKGENVPYHLGKFAPQDFLFELHVREVNEAYVTNQWHYVYLKPFRTSPVKSIHISAQDNSASTGVDIQYQVSQNGRDWKGLNEANRRNFTNPETMTYVRACLKMNGSIPAQIDWMDIDLEYEAPSDMYVRTHYYNPKTSPMLGAALWGRVFSNFETEPTVKCTAELISQQERIEHITTINLNDLADYAHLDEINESDVTGKTMQKLCTYVEANPQVLDALKKINVYIIPYTDNENVRHYFFDRFQLYGKPAYPILEVTQTPISSPMKSFSEGADFTVNYQDSEIVKTFNNEENIINPDEMWFYPDILENMVRGTFTIRYNPVIVDNLTSEEIGRRENDEGLILDYFKESITADDSLTENRTIRLRTTPADPIRKVTVNEEQLLEDRDYMVDFDNNSIILTDGIIKTGDAIEVAYVPAIEDDGLALGFNCKRENTRKQAYIRDSYWEYKV